MTIELLAPAKINLGLEVIRRRADGYHDIATVFQTISLFDRIEIVAAGTNEVRIRNIGLQIDENLAHTALRLVTSQTSTQYLVEIEKRIPVAAGLGGASADAAAVLRGLQPPERSERLMRDQALKLGSDVPFLLRGGAALATGRGEVLQSIPSLTACWLVLATPAIAIERKTARLYGALRAEDFSEGARVDSVAQHLRDGDFPEAQELVNAFTRPLAELVPEIALLSRAFERAGASFVALSGAGPTHYTFAARLSDAIRMAGVLKETSEIPLRAMVVRPVGTGVQIRVGKTSTA